MGILKPIDFLVVQHSNDRGAGYGEGEWLGFVQTIKSYIKQENQTIKDRIEMSDQRSRKILSQNKTVEKSIEDIKENVKTFQEHSAQQIRDLSKDIKETKTELESKIDELKEIILRRV